MKFYQKKDDPSKIVKIIGEYSQEMVVGSIDMYNVKTVEGKWNKTTTVDSVGKEGFHYTFDPITDKAQLVKLTLKYD